MMTEPTRLLDDPSFAASLRADLAQAKAAAVTGLDTTAGAASLGAAIAAEGAGVTAAGAGVSKGLLLGVGGVIAAGAIALATAGSPASPRVAAAPQPELANPVPVAEAAMHEPPAADPQRAVAPEPQQAEPEPAEAEPEPEPTDPAPAQADPKPKAAPKPKPAQSDYVAEAKLIAKARRVMKRDPEAALVLLERARSTYPEGLLGEEREALTILSLHALGRPNASSRAERFLQRHAESPYAEAVRRVEP